MHRICMLHNQAYTHYFLSMHSSLQLRASTTIYSQVCELQGSPMIFYFLGHSGVLSPPCSPWSQQLGEHPSYAPTFYPYNAATSPTFYPMIPWSRKTMTATNPRSACPPGSPIFQLLLRQLLSHFMPSTVLRPSFGSCQVELMTCTSRCALLNSHLRAACQFMRCRIRICMRAVNVCTAEFLDSPYSRQPIPWRFFLSGLDIPASSPCLSTICVADFSLMKLQMHKSALPISTTVGMDASTLRHYFGQTAEACTSCIFDTVTPFFFPFNQIAQALLIDCNERCLFLSWWVVLSRMAKDHSLYNSFYVLHSL